MKHDSFDVKLFHYLCNFTLRGCTLSFEDLRNIMVRASIGEAVYCLSHNVFENKDWKFIDEIKKHFVIFPEGKEVLKSFDLRCCNFSDEEKELLRKALQCCSVLI